QGAGGPVAGRPLPRTEDLLQGGTTDSFPDVGEVAAKVRLFGLRVAAQRDRSLLRIDDLRVGAVNLQGGTDAGEYEVSPVDPLLLKPLHPFGDTAGQFPQYVPPIADRGILRTGTADEVYASG